MTDKDILVLIVLLIALGLFFPFMDESTLEMITGKATTNINTVINVGEHAEAMVDSNYNSIDFDGCVIPTTPISISSEMNKTEIEALEVNCTGNFPSFIRVRNGGNINIQIIFTINQDIRDIFNSNNAEVYYKTNVNTTNNGCNHSVNWTQIDSTSTEYVLCNNLSYGTNYPQIDLYLNVTFPNDAETHINPERMRFTFIASKVE